MIRSLISVLALIVLASSTVTWPEPAHAQLYTYVNANGVKVYTDRRPEGEKYSVVSGQHQGSAGTRSSTQLFVYQDASGERLITNLRQRDSALTLIATYGRPTASINCNLRVSEALRIGSGPYDDIITRVAAAHALDPILIKTVIWVESCFDPKAVSRVGAQGLMQLMPGTAAELGVTDSFDPEQNIRGGTTYLAQMLKRFNGDLNLALAAYNAGPGAVQRHGGVPPFRETLNYIERINGHYHRYAQTDSTESNP